MSSGRRYSVGKGRQAYAALELVLVMGLTLAIASSLWLLVGPALAAFHRLARVFAGWPF